MKYKYCGNCKRFANENADGWGTCSLRDMTRCDDVCNFHAFANNGWTEITQDNEEEVYNIPVDRLMIAVIVHGKAEYMEYREMFQTISAIAKLGGYYYYELPELNFE